jgi:hypothetical protein
MCVLTILFSGCKSPIVTPYWEENENRFNTNDSERAQKDIPFPIIIPTYLPRNNPKKVLPDIEGPLSQFQDGNNIEIIIRYSLDIGNYLPGAIMASESNFAYSLGEPVLDPDLELIEIEGIPVVKTKDDFSGGSDAYYSFNSKDIYYNVETHGIPNEESNEIVESMVNQISED